MADKCEDDSLSMRMTLFGIRKAFPNVKQLQTENLATYMEENRFKNLILLDVRGEEEFNVSHLPSAIRVQPDEPVSPVMMKVKKRLENIADHHARIVCYCSVGYRSSKMAQNLYPEFKKLKANEELDMTSELCNLEGSIFKWANEGRELVDCNNMKTRFCHPYNYLWGRLLEADRRLYRSLSRSTSKC